MTEVSKVETKVSELSSSKNVTIPKPKADRNHALDGLRGFAALMVVLHHFTQTQPFFADRFDRPASLAPKPWTNSWQNILEGTPLHFFHAGPEAVFIFFVLSGYVLFPAVCRTNLNIYVRTRMVRLYVPVVASVLLAELLLFLAPHGVTSHASSWLNTYPLGWNISEFIKSLYLLDGTGSLNSALWSMRYEVLFSLLILAVLPVRQPIRSKNLFVSLSLLFLATCLIFFGAHQRFDVLTYLPMFFMGVLLHYIPEFRIGVVIEFVVGALVLIGPWLLWSLGTSLNRPQAHAMNAVGALIIVDSVRKSDSVVNRFFASKPMRILGAHSYPLYLVHVPIILAVWYTFGDATSFSGNAERVLVSAVIIVLVTSLFYRFVEKPCMRWIANFKEAHSN
jgi:peptidoglycan/LPS O-acetylase OafA/YrhL